jgi:2-keto-3-deoxy-L-rhamnonate aldolase RhmA
MLDLGALGIIVPMVETPEQCAAIVRAVKFPPTGGRSATGLRTAYHANHDYFEYVKGANDQIMTVVMVETPLGVRNVRQMMSIPEIDCVLIGPYDLTLSAGGSWPDDPRAEALMQEVLAASKEKAVAAGYYTNDPSEAQIRADQGFRMVFLGHDMAQLPLAFQDMKRRSAQLGAKPTPSSNPVHPRRP